MGLLLLIENQLWVIELSFLDIKVPLCRNDLFVDILDFVNKVVALIPHFLMLLVFLVLGKFVLLDSSV